jgi:glycosyltransferase involved in cell wall biosynthesis
MNETLESNKKIAFIGPAPPFRGGISQFAFRLAQEFQRAGNEIKMFTFEHQYPELLFPGKGQTADFSQSAEIDIEKVFTPYNPASWSKVIKSIEAFAPDLTIISYFLPWFAPSYTWICKHLSSTRNICLAHNITFHEKWPGSNLLSRQFFKHCDKIVVLSEACLQDLQNTMPEDIAGKGILGFHPIYDCYGAASDDFEINPAEEPTALFFGLIKPYKGLDILIKALKQARIKIPELKLIIAGEVYGKEDKYLSLIHQLHLEDAIEAHFRYIQEHEIRNFFLRSQVCVLPYKSATQSGVIATAYEFNLPVIASRVGGLSEYVKDNVTGILVPPDNPEALAAALIRFFKEDLFSVMHRNIPSFKQQFSWQKLAEIILQA